MKKTSTLTTTSIDRWVRTTLLAGRVRDERGDVPGWVMVTVMTAMLVVGIGAVAQDELEALLQGALDRVTSSW